MRTSSLLPILLLAALARAEDKKPIVPSRMAPLAQYRMATTQDEIALARSAAPPSISADAEVLVLGKRGYEVAVKGKNGFVCLVERSWMASFEDPQFWNPRLRGPDCLNPAAVRTVLPQYLKRTESVLAGATREKLVDEARSAFASHSFGPPEAGSFGFMLSRNGYVSDDAAGPWLPHVMLFVPHGQAASCGAGLEGSPVLGVDGSPIEPTVLLIPVRRWSDGTPAPAPPVLEAHQH
jgi:hypothetical protein